VSTTEKNSIVAIYPSHVEAEAAVNELKRSGVDIKKLSIVGSVHTREEVIGSYTAGDRIRYWGESGAFWGGVGGCF
jgi:hypothetical protein